MKLPIEVAPRRGAWIETEIHLRCAVLFQGRTPQGCVD